jgi:hypothetical protein
MRSKAKKTANPQAADVAAMDKRIRIILALMLESGWRRRLAVFDGCFGILQPVLPELGVICPETGQIVFVKTRVRLHAIL